MSKIITINDLPYPKDALEPVISARTLEFHFEKHHKGYLNKLNELIASNEDFKAQDLLTIVKKSFRNNAPVFNNAAQVFNHSFYWESLTPKFREPSETMKQMIDHSFGSYENFRKEFVQHGITQFGSGWVWLILNNDNKLEIVKTSNAETPITENQKVLLTCDVWEHAYYLDYQNRRPDYLEQFLDRLVNWDFAQTNLSM